MTLSKTEGISNESIRDGIEFEQYSEILKAISHPVRLQILQVLLNGSKCVTDIVSSLDLPQAIVSHHLGVLRNGGVLNRRKEGTRIWYGINCEFSKTITSYLAREIHTRTKT